TVLTPEDFEKADIESDDITSYMTAMMINSANNGIIYFDSITGHDIRLPIYIVTVPERDTINIYKQPALLNTKWHQGSPFNDMYPFANSGVHCQAGCGVIAVAQILAYNQYPHVLDIYDNLFDWNIINKFIEHPNDQSASDTEHLASFIYNLGSLMHMENDLIYNRTGTYIENAANAMRHLGYRSVSSHTFSYSDAQNMICNDKLVFLMNGTDSKNSNNPHEWVIDGWNAYTVKLWSVTYDTRERVGNPDPLEKSRELIQTTNVKKMHCNFGWGGKCDGYYTYNLFNTDDYTFNCNFNMITYSLP
ncbi:MAG: C10 family peptidase, partial [Alistipes sp.]|nr:C10 family peptidase [Alistipes sp.]